MKEIKPQDVAIRIRGEDTRLGEVVPRGFPQVMTNKNTPKVNREQSGRLQLADWIASADNPLTARVIVNRVWQHLFGEGLVGTPDNFGASGQAPSNPALLDHLAHRLIDQHWSLKSLIREIMLSRAYQLSSDHDSYAYEIDPANRLNWRMSRRRLDSDAIFDAMLFVSGDLEVGRPPERFAIINGDQRLKSFDQASWLKPVAKRRTVYQPIFRGCIPDDWNVFDFPDPELIVGRRDVTTVPTQALYMLNSPFVVERSQQLAKHIRAETAGRDDSEAIQRVYHHLLGRKPTHQETVEGTGFLREFPGRDGQTNPDASLSAFCQSILGSAEFRYLY